MSYESEIAKINPLTLEAIEKNCRSRLPASYKSRPWALAYPDKDFAKIFTEEQQLDAYSAAYTSMHVGKLRRVFDKANGSSTFTANITVIDWGCGQGLATLALKEYLEEKKISQYAIKEVILIEPSQIALSRADVNVRYALPGVIIRKVPKGLNDLKLEDVRIATNHRIVHLFSNILDIDGISIKNIAENLKANLFVDNCILCASPFYPRMENRYQTLLSYFENASPWTDFQSAKEKENPYTYSLMSFKLGANRSEQVVCYSYYPPVRFEAGYALDCVFDAVSQSDDAQRLLRLLSSFRVSAPFEFGVADSRPRNPVLAVLNNIVCRGLPTLCATEIEDAFAEEFSCSKVEIEYGGLRYKSILEDKDKKAVLEAVKGFDATNDERINKLVFAPIAMARLHKVFIEAMSSGRLDFSRPEWNILVEEQDVEFAEKGFEVIDEMIRHITALVEDESLLKVPEIKLTVVSAKKSNMAPDIEYDMVIYYTSAVLAGECNFAKYKVRNKCAFHIGSTSSKNDPLLTRQIYTSDQIVYRELVTKNADGLYSSIEENVVHLRYFLKLLFRKVDFRPGQLPVLSRAVRNKSVIGLLPTGGGKSLTYQLAAMLQPGVTIVIEPLISLMHDQYEGLKKVHIDYCAEINLMAVNALQSEKNMAASKLLFVFVSPERLCILRFRQKLHLMNELGVYFSYGVIDEVHCVSEWGHDFRFPYLHLGRNLYRYVRPRGCENGRRISLFGLTATASFDVLSDVERDLSGEGAFPLDADAVIRYENTNRLELQYRVVKVSPKVITSKWDVYAKKNEMLPAEVAKGAGCLLELQSECALSRIKERFLERENIVDQGVKDEIEARDLRIAISEKWSSERPNRSAGIVFCPHRRGNIGVDNSENNLGIASIVRVGLDLQDVDVAKYVGGDDLTEQNRFLNGDASIMVSTKAFGMGIDKPNVRFTWHVNYSSSLESFVQEAGRAGRDRKMALATILCCPATMKQQDELGQWVDIPYDLAVPKYFYDQSFKSPEFEKMVMYHLMNKGKLELIVGEELDEENVLESRTVCGFLNELLKTKVGDRLTYIISTEFNDEDPGVKWLKKKCGVNKKNYRDVIHKAIYRMCVIGVIDDYTENYVENKIRIVAECRNEEDYYNALKRFLVRYYTETKADIEVEEAKKLKGENAIQKCLSYLTEFVYTKVAKKRWQAMWDMHSFCKEAIEQEKGWLEANEDLKDFIYYYFNSKYAREGYTAESGELFSLTDDTDAGKKSSFDIVFKYMRVVDDDITGAEGSPRDNIKHLQGAVRLIRRSLTDVNSALDLLNVFCLIFLKKEIEGSEHLKKELINSYYRGYCDFRDSCQDLKLFWENMKKFSCELKKRNVIDDDQMAQLEEWQAEAEVVYQSKWLKGFAEKFTK